MKDIEFEFNKITNDGNTKRLSELMFACFGKKADESYFKWKYFDNPAGDLIAYEALYEGKSVGFYGIIPELYTLDGKVEKVYQSMDTMTHPDFQRRGLFIKLARLTYEDALENEGKLFIVGFPGGQSYGGFIKKLDWKTIKEDCSYMFIPRPLFSLKNLFMSSKSITIQKYEVMTDELAEYFSKIKPTTKISKYFDTNIFQWKIFDNPNYDYNIISIKKENEILGVCVYRIESKKSCEISWLNFIDLDNYKIYIKHFLKYIFAETKIRYIYSWTPQNGYLAEGYRKAGLMVNTINKGPFIDRFPLIIYENGFPSALGTGNFDNYEFQPVLLD